jgi:DnaJ-class molecular chaperone|tara:strand:+ start:2913 stop:3806 length:894 start_codon:yes stop_codon:yes gene_type:complete
MDLYEILGSDKNSTTNEIKKHYYSLSKKHHPDKNNGKSDEKFKLLSEAYSVLSNPKKRYLYDMKLLFRDNLGDNFIDHFSDSELITLHNYYQTLQNSTEFKFLKLLYNSLPVRLKERVRKKFKGKIYSESLIDISQIKYIWTIDLNENFEMNLNRSLKDVYLNTCKEIIVLTRNNSYDLFITHSDYSLKIYLQNDFYLTINIQTSLPEKYSMNGLDLYYNHRINLYEYYFIDLFPITLPNDFEINLINSEELNSSVRIPSMGIKGISSRGDLYIYKELDLTINNKDHYREILKEIFT